MASRKRRCDGYRGGWTLTNTNGSRQHRVLKSPAALLASGAGCRSRKSTSIEVEWYTTQAKKPCNSDGRSTGCGRGRHCGRADKERETVFAAACPKVGTKGHDVARTNPNSSSTK